MGTEVDEWSPISVLEVNQVLSNIPISWCIAGGEALDLHMGKKSREHHDLDVVIFREEQQVLYQSLKSEWLLYKAQDGMLNPWREGEFLKSVNDIWVKKSMNTPWSFQIMLLDSENGEWVYRREKSIKRAKNQIFLRTNEGIPYLKPEIQLLYKGGLSQVREKDFQDFQIILPYLLPKEKEWLKLSLKMQFPGGHHWLGEL